MRRTMLGSFLMALAACVATRGASLPEGTAAPDFTLAAADGSQVHHADVNRDRWTVVVFYRGDWCPFCRAQLGELERNRHEFARRKASILAISVDPPATSRALATRLGGLGFPLLSDPDLAVALSYGVAMEGEQLAVPSIFLIAPRGRIVWRDIGERIDDRPTAQWVLWKLDEAKRTLRL